MPLPVIGASLPVDNEAGPDADVEPPAVVGGSSAVAS